MLPCLMLAKRTNLLLDEYDHAMLVGLASQSNKTIGELIRYAVKKTYKSKKTLSANERAFRMIGRATKGLNFSGIDYKALINDGRKY